MMTKLPPWFKQEIPGSMALKMMRLISEYGVNTVCREAKCPNTARCFKEKTATFMILGKACTRSCAFCAVNKADRGVLALDPSEPERIALFAKRLELEYAVITSVTRDDLKDGGSAHFARVIKTVREFSPAIKIETLIPDFAGNSESLSCLIGASPSILAHNLETVERLYPVLRPASDYILSLKVLSMAKMHKTSLVTKSSLMLGFGEKEEEVVKAMQDLREVGCDILTLGQYLAPSARHYQVKEFISLEQFNRYRRIGISLGFKAVSSGPLVRSSYDAHNFYRELNYA
jgi:lipoic acid synthetase